MLLKQYYTVLLVSLTHQSLHSETYLFVCLVGFWFILKNFLWEERLQGHRPELREWGDERNQDVKCEIHEQSVKTFFKKS